MLRWVCLGGWCGPSLTLSKLGLRQPSEPASPFDFVRCSMDAITYWTRTGDFRSFFATDIAGPSSPTEYATVPVDPVSIWLLQRCQHTCFAHFDVNRKSVQQTYIDRFQAYQSLLRGREQDTRSTHPPTEARRPLVFLRTILACNIVHEVEESIRFQTCLQEIGAFQVHPTIRILLIAHDQRLSKKTQRIGIQGIALPPNVALWSLEYDREHSGNGLFGRTHASYEHIVHTMCDDASWSARAARDVRLVSRDALRWCSNLSHVEGVPIFLYSEEGFGTMQAHHPSSTVFRVQDPTKWDVGRAWDATEDAALLHLLAQEQSTCLDGDLDIVKVVEEAANTLKRGANETLKRLRHLTSK